MLWAPFLYGPALLSVGAPLIITTDGVALLFSFSALSSDSPCCCPTLNGSMET
jgi:hypothetical protein